MIKQYDNINKTKAIRLRRYVKDEISVDAKAIKLFFWKKMELSDQTLTCQDCGKEFVFSANDQKFYEEKGFQAPKRCPECRKAKKATRDKKYEITCSKCGEKGEVPFEPKNPEGLLCEKCFRESKAQEQGK